MLRDHDRATYDSPPGGGIWIVLPTYNERENLPRALEAIRGAVPDALVLVVDDGSPDGTGVLADEMAATDAQLEVLHRTTKDGLGSAYRAAFRALLDRGSCRAIVQMDCDLSHDPADVPRLLAALEDGVDLAIGSRYVRGGATPGWSLSRRLISRAGSLFARTVLQLPVRDLTGGFKAWRPTTLARAMADSKYAHGYGFQVEMTWRARRGGARIAEIPIIFRDRVAGESKMGRDIVLEAFVMVLRLRLEGFRRRP